jgi:acyl-CoA hydrolase
VGKVAASKTAARMECIVMPGQCNALGTAFGGSVMGWIDICAAISAQRFSRGEVVTASMDHLTFQAAVRLGDVVVLESMVNLAGRTSMEVGVRVEVEDMRTGARTRTATCYLTFVAVDSDGNPRQVPELVPDSDGAKGRMKAGLERRRRRLELREAARCRD